jgi:hypothetical protein
MTRSMTRSTRRSMTRSAKRVVLVAGALLCVAARPAQARNWRSLQSRLQGAAWLHYELTGLHDVEDTAASSAPPHAPSLHELVLAGARLHGIVGGGGPILYHVGFDVLVGGTARGAGFAYDLSLFPIGAAVRLGQTSLVAIGAGVGVSGATSTLDDAVMLPVELTSELGGGRVRLLMRARAAYALAARSRREGAPSLPLGDELDATVGVRIGRHYDEGFPAGNGYFVAAAYRELEGGRFVGLTIGYSIDIATYHGASAAVAE